MRKVELLPTRDCEAGYGPGVIVLIFQWVDDKNCYYKRNPVRLEPATHKEILALEQFWSARIDILTYLMIITKPLGSSTATNDYCYGPLYSKIQ